MTQKDPKDEHKSDHKIEHKAESKTPDPKPDHRPTKLVRMQKGTDEVNHGVTRYPVERDGTVRLPYEVAEHVIRQGGAEDLTPKEAAPEGFVEVRHISDPNAGLSWGGEQYRQGKDAKLSVPVAALADIEPHGFIPC